MEDKLHENGKLVEGESIADLGGVVIAYAAYQRSLAGKSRPPEIDGFTPSSAFSWATPGGGRIASGRNSLAC